MDNIFIKIFKDAGSLANCYTKLFSKYKKAIDILIMRVNYNYFQYFSYMFFH